MRYKVTIYSYDTDYSYVVEAASPSKAKYKAFKEWKESGIFAAKLTFAQYLNLFKPDVLPILSNGDRIRAMSDELLAEFITKITDCCTGDGGCKECPIAVCINPYMSLLHGNPYRCDPIQWLKNDSEEPCKYAVNVGTDHPECTCRHYNGCKYQNPDYLPDRKILVVNCMRYQTGGYLKELPEEGAEC